jgi:hypothetical protein
MECEKPLPNNPIATTHRLTELPMSPPKVLAAIDAREQT